jgi:hypothetical protein
MLAGFLFSEECKIKVINDYAKCFNNLIQIHFDPSIISDGHFGLLAYKKCSDINVGFCVKCKIVYYMAFFISYP